MTLLSPRHTCPTKVQATIFCTCMCAISAMAADACNDQTVPNASFAVYISSIVSDQRLPILAVLCSPLLMKLCSTSVTTVRHSIDPRKEP